MLKYKVGFFILCGLFVLFWTWVIIAVVTKTRPTKVLKSLFPQKIEREDNYVVPVSFFEQLKWIKDISPDSTTIKALKTNNNRISIEFNQDMDTTFYHVEKEAVYTIDIPLKYTMHWQNNRIFITQLDRSLQDGEYFILIIDFKKTDGYLLPTVVLNYE